MNFTLAAPSMMIDLRQIAPRDRRALILARFDTLQPGQSLELINDHDPQALRVHFEDRAFGQYAWRDVENGPASWRVRVGKRGANPSSAAVDSCCSGGACCG